MEHFSQSQWPSWAYTNLDDSYNSNTYTQLPSYPNYLADSMDAYQMHQSHLLHPQHMSRTTESKPRLSKEEVELLEAEFQKNHKPNSSTKKALAESMRVDNARINNWFQNRRAREKKENNIREYEAKQKLEKEKTDSETSHRLDTSRQRDLVPSSAPFPDATKSSSRQPQSSCSPSNVSTTDVSSEAASSIRCPDMDDATSPFTCLPHASETTIADAVQTGSEGSVSVSRSDDMSEYFAASETNSLQSPDVFSSLDDKASQDIFDDSYRQFMTEFERNNSTPPHGQAMFAGHSYFDTNFDSMYLDDGMGIGVDDDLSTESTGSQLKTPPNTDIASRRNRRPAPLALGMRSQSAYAPKTAIDMSKLKQHGSAMRRVSSATGSGRITKSASTPRSPFDRRAEAVLGMSRSPSATAPGTMAPPTPDTPIITSQNAADGSVSGVNGKRPSVGWAPHDPTLRTPPTTPGVMGNIFSLSSNYGVPVSADTLGHVPMNHFLDDFASPQGLAGVPGYFNAARSNSSQSDISSLDTQINSSSLGFFGSNADFNWTNA